MRRFRATSRVGLFKIAIVTSAALPAALASAATIFWDGTGTTWNGTTPWSTVGNASTPDPAAKPGALDIANFNISTLNTAQTVNLDAAQSALGLVFSGTGTVLVQSGTGSNGLTLGASGITVNSGSGADTISSALTLGAAQAWTNNAASTLTISGIGGPIAEGGNALTVGGSGATSITGIISGSGGITKSDGGTLTLSAANTYTGGTVVNGGTLALTHGTNDTLSAVGGSTLTINNTGIVHADATNTLGFNGNGPAITINTGGLFTTGSGASVHLNNVTLNGGTLSSTSASGQAATFGTLNLDNNVTAGGSAATSVISAQSFALTTPGGTTFTVNPGATSGIDLDVPGLIGAPSGVTNTALIKAGAGVMRLSNSGNNFNGVAINAGTLSVANDGALGNQTAPLTFRGGTLQSTASFTLAQGRAITLNAGDGTFNVDPSTTLTINQIMIGQGGLVKTGAGELDLNSTTNATSTFSGPVNINSGTVVISKSSGFSTGVFTSTVVNVGDGVGAAGSAALLESSFSLPQGANYAALSIQADGFFSPGSENIASLTMTGGEVKPVNGLTLTIFGNITTLASSNTALISRAGVSGAGSLFLNGNLGSGTITVAQGTTPNGVDLDVAVPISSNLAPITKAGPGTMRLSGGNGGGFARGLILASGTILIANDNAIVGSFEMDGGAIQADGAARTLTVPVFYTNTATIGGNFDLTLSNSLSGTGGLTKNGTSTLTLSGSNSLGSILVNAGALVTSANTFFTGSGVTNFGTFVYNGGSFASRLINFGAVTLNADLVAQNGIDNDSVMTLAAGRMITANGAGLNNQGTFNMTGGQLNLSTTALNANRGNFNLSTTLTLGSAQLLNLGSIAMDGGVVSGLTTPSELINETSGVISGNGLITAVIINNGTIAPTGGSFNIFQTFTNAGDIEMSGNAATLTGGLITNTATIEGFGKINSAVTNNGTIQAIGGTLVFTSNVTNSAGGTIRAATGDKVLMQGASVLPTNAGLISLTGGTFDNGGNALTNTGRITGDGTLVTGGLTNNGQVQFSGGNIAVFGAVTSNSGSKISIAGNGVCSFFDNVTINSGATFTVASGSTAVFFGTVSGAGSATVGGLLTLDAGDGVSTGINQINSLTFVTNGRVDLTSDELITTASAASVRAQLLGGTIFTSQTTPGRALGYADIGGGQTEVRYTLLGDATLNGSVDVGDLGALATNYGITTGASWSQGDFNYDDKVDVGDLGALATTYGKSIGGGLSDGAIAVALPASAVPEPACIALLGLATLASLRSRRPRRRHVYMRI